MIEVRRVGRAAVALLLAVALGGCGGAPEPVFDQNVNIGEAPSTPGWGSRDSAGRHTGFDYDLANWLGEHVGFNPVPVDVIAATREGHLQAGKVTLVVATYSITDKRREVVGFAGPYMVGYQGVMVRASEQSNYRRVTDLTGKTVCATRKSTSADQVRGLGFPVTVIERDVYEHCIGDLRAGAIDAISTDQLILYGLLQENPDFYVPRDVAFGQQERYGVGLPKGDVAKCEAVTTALKTFLIDGFWETFLKNNLPGVDPTGHKPDPNNMDPC